MAARRRFSAGNAATQAGRCRAVFTRTGEPQRRARRGGSHIGQWQRTARGVVLIKPRIKPKSAPFPANIFRSRRPYGIASRPGQDDISAVPERFPTLLNQSARTGKAPDHCLGEHLYPTGDPVWSDHALEGMPLNDIGVSSPFIDSETIDEMSLAQGAVPVMLAPYLPIAVCAFVPGVANLLYCRRLCCYRYCEAGLPGRAEAGERRHRHSQTRLVFTMPFLVGTAFCAGFRFRPADNYSRLVRKR